MHKNRPVGIGGYTVVEIMVFLTVSTLIVGSAIALFSTRIPSAQFSQSVHELETKIRSVSNDVLNGYYPSASNFSCKINNGQIEISSLGSSSEQGTNEECVFLGRAVQFTENSDEVSIYNIVGRRLSPSGSIVSTLADAQPKAIDSVSGGAAGPENFTTGFGLKVESIVPVGTTGVMFTQSFGSSAVGANVTGASQLEFYPFNITGALTDIDPNLLKDKNSGISICLGDGSNRRAKIHIGEGGNPHSTRVEFVSSC